MAKINYTKLTYKQMADMIRALWHEMKRRNPIGINLYQTAMYGAFAAIEEIQLAELENPTSECGPGSRGKRLKGRKNAL